MGEAKVDQRATEQPSAGPTTGRRPARSDADRLRALRKLELQGKADHLLHKIDRLRRELALIVHTPGGSWSDPRAVELSGRIDAAIKQWEAAVQEMHVTMKETKT